MGLASFNKARREAEKIGKKEAVATPQGEAVDEVVKEVAKKKATKKKK